MSRSDRIAHVSEDGRVHSLQDHLRGTAERTYAMAGEFGCAEWGYLAGLWHDLGKYSEAFQKMIRAAAGLDAHVENAPGRVDHSTAGALWADRQFQVRGRLLEYLIAGHHAGLPDWLTDFSGNKSLYNRLKQTPLLDAAIVADIPREVLDRPFPRDRPPKGADPALWLRMIFSCVVDADFLDTEAFFDPPKASQRGGYPSLEELEPAFTAYMQNKQAEAAPTKVNQIRAKILANCQDIATRPPGILRFPFPPAAGRPSRQWHLPCAMP